MTDFVSLTESVITDYPNRAEADLLVSTLAQFSLYVHKGGLKPDAFHFY